MDMKTFLQLAIYRDEVAKLEKEVQDFVLKMIGDDANKMVLSPIALTCTAVRIVGMTAAQMEEPQRTEAIENYRIGMNKALDQIIATILEAESEPS